MMQPIASVSSPSEQSYIATRRLLISLSMWPPALARYACFAARLEPHNVADRFGVLALHVEAVVDVPM